MKDLIAYIIEKITKVIFLIMAMVFLVWIISVGLESISSKQNTPIQLKTSMELELDAENINDDVTDSKTS